MDLAQPAGGEVGVQLEGELGLLISSPDHLHTAQAVHLDDSAHQRFRSDELAHGDPDTPHDLLHGGHSAGQILWQIASQGREAALEPGVSHESVDQVQLRCRHD